MDSEGVVDCWISEEWGGETLESALSPVESVATNADYITSSGWGGGLLYAHVWDGPTTAVDCFDGDWSCRPPAADWLQAGVVNGLLPDGRLAVWDPSEHGGLLMSESAGLHALAGGVTPAAVSDDNVVVTFGFDVEEHLPIPHDREITHLAPGFWGVGDPFSACVLDVAGELTCFGHGPLAEAEFLHPPYRDLDGDRNVACAVREADDVIDCSDGTVHDFGPIRELQVFPYVQLVDDDLDYSQASLCVITTENAIRCAGPHYPPDLQAQLAALPR